MAQFRPEMFTARPDSTPQDKADFANHLVAFLQSGCPESLFPDWFYRRLSRCFGHVSRFSKDEFYRGWFRNWAGRNRFVRRILDWKHSTGDFGDVERAFREWLALTDIPSRYNREARAADAAADRKLLSDLGL